MPPKTKAETKTTEPLSFHAAFAKAQSEFEPVGADGTGHVGREGAREYKYATLASVLTAVRPALNNNGLMLTQTVSTIENVLTLTTRVTDGTDSIESTVPLPHPEDWQRWGSAMTYARRYSLSAVLGIAPDQDDDGANAAPAHKEADYGVCAIHGGARFFMTGNMPRPAHKFGPKSDTEGPEWCNKKDDETTVQDDGDPYADEARREWMAASGEVSTALNSLGLTKQAERKAKVESMIGDKKQAELTAEELYALADRLRTEAEEAAQPDPEELPGEELPEPEPDDTEGNV